MTNNLMSRSICCILALALLVPLGAAEAGKKRAATVDQNLPSTQVADLTAGECKRLGGFTEANRNCKSGETCITITRDHVEHSSCIDELEQ